MSQINFDFLEMNERLQKAKENANSPAAPEQYKLEVLNTEIRLADLMMQNERMKMMRSNQDLMKELAKKLDVVAQQKYQK